MKIKNEKLKVYEFLYNRVSFSKEEIEEYHKLKRMDVFECIFNDYLKKIDKKNIEIYWHLSLPIEERNETIEAMIVTATSIHLFKILDLSGAYEISPFNVLLKDNEPIMDLNITEKYYEAMKDTDIRQNGFLKPIFFNYVVFDDTFSVSGFTGIPFLTPRTLSPYLKKIEQTSTKKQHAPF